MNLPCHYSLYQGYHYLFHGVQLINCLSKHVLNLIKKEKMMLTVIHRGSVSKETVVLCHWGHETQKYGFIN